MVTTEKSFAEAKADEIRERLEELRPLVSEVDRLEAALRVLNGDAPEPKRRGRPPKNL